MSSSAPNSSSASEPQLVPILKKRVAQQPLEDEVIRIAFIPPTGTNKIQLMEKFYKPKEKPTFKAGQSKALENMQKPSQLLKKIPESVFQAIKDVALAKVQVKEDNFQKMKLQSEPIKTEEREEKNAELSANRSQQCKNNQLERDKVVQKQSQPLTNKDQLKLNQFTQSQHQVSKEDKKQPSKIQQKKWSTDFQKKSNSYPKRAQNMSRMINKMRVPCRFFPNCSKPRCEFFHPQIPCKFLPNCKNGDNCNYFHKNCRNWDKCTYIKCAYRHPTYQSMQKKSSERGSNQEREPRQDRPTLQNSLKVEEPRAVEATIKQLEQPTHEGFQASNRKN